MNPGKGFDLRMLSCNIRIFVPSGNAGGNVHV